MKKILILLLFSISALGWYSEPVLQKLGVLKPAPESRNIPPQRAGFIMPDPEPVAKEQQTCMSLEEYAAQAKTNPEAYYKMLFCGEQAGERTEFDKLMNFFTRLKYE
ncbi:MAG: hypothetical protein V1879_03760 [Pseudomonadota bacterium]